MNNKTTLFDDLQDGLNQAIDYANGVGSARVFTRIIDSAKDSDKDQRRKKQFSPSKNNLRLNNYMLRLLRTGFFLYYFKLV